VIETAPPRRGRHGAIENESIEAANRVLQSKKVKGGTLEIEATIEPGQAWSATTAFRRSPAPPG